MTTETSNARGEVVACAHCGRPRDSAMHSFSDRYLEAQDMYHEFIPKAATPPPPDAARGDVPYDRELIAQIIDVPRAYTNECRQEQARLLREADNAAVANVGTVAARGDVRGLVAELRKLCSWKHLMSYNEAYFGEPEGELKSVVYAIERKLPSLAAEGVQAGEDPDLTGYYNHLAKLVHEHGTAKVEQRARELLAAEYERDGFDPVQAQQIRDGYVNNTTATALRAIVAALSQQPEARGVVDGEVKFNAAFFVSRTGDRIEQLTTYSDYRRDGSILALMDLGQKRASARGLTKKNAGKVTLAWVTAPQIIECDAALTGERNG